MSTTPAEKEVKHDTSRLKEQEATQSASGVALSAPYAPAESASCQVKRSATNKGSPKTTAKSFPHCTETTKEKTKHWQKNDTCTEQDGCEQYSSDENSEIEEATQPGAFGIAGPQADSDLNNEDQPAVDGSNEVDGDMKDNALLVEADLAPEFTAAAKVNIQEDEAVVVKKKQYKRVLWFSTFFYGLAIIGIAASIVLLFVNPPPAFGRLYYNPVWNGMILAGILLMLGTCVMFIPTTRPCCRSSIKLEEYAPDDTQLLRDAQIASVVSFSLIAFLAIPIICCLPEQQWIACVFVTWSLAGTIFSFSRIRLLQRPNETRQKKPKLFWFGFVVFFLALSSLTIWRCLNPLYPDCHVPFATFIGDGECDRGPYATEVCGFDGGDCIQFLQNYPHCDVKYPLWIGDGECDEGAYNTKECGYDGGDCTVEYHHYPDCIVPQPSWIGDGICDGRVYGTVECGYDGGDCLKPGEYCLGHRECASEVCNSVTKVCDSAFVSDLYPNCSVGMPNWIGDGECDGGYYASAACGFDGGDCLKLGEPCSQDKECASGFCNAVTKVCYLGDLESYPDCIVEYPKKVGDGECDGGDYATKECGYDGGDCLNPETLNSSVPPSLFPSFHIAAIVCFAFFHFIL